MTRRMAVSVLLGVLPSAPAAAAAPVTLSLSVSTSTLRDHRWSATASIQLRTGHSAQRVSLGLEPSLWQDRDMFGSPLRTSDQRVTGAGPAPIFLGAVVGIAAPAPGSSEIDYYHLGPHQFTIRGPTGVRIKLAAVAGARHERNAPYPVLTAGHDCDLGLLVR